MSTNEPRRPYRDAQHYLDSAWTAFDWAHERIERYQPDSVGTSELHQALMLLAEAVRNGLRAIEKVRDPTYESADEVRAHLDAQDRERTRDTGP